MAVSNGLGHRFLESVYERAMIEELKLRASDLPVGLLMNFGKPRGV